MAKDGILLESGTNEVEILEFVLNGQPFGVNVLKIQAIEQYDPSRVTQIQLSHPSVVGTLLFRDNCITLVDLGKEMESGSFADGVEDPVEQAVAEVATEELLHQTPSPVSDEDRDPADGAESEGQTRLVLVMEFNDLKTAFLVDGVNRIHRMSWESISPLSAFLSSTDSKFTGSLQIEGREILLVDMEKVVTEILPGGLDTNLVPEATDHPLAEARARLPIFLAEDSGVISAKVKGELARGNYTQVKTFANGRECYDAIARLTEQARAEDRPITDFLGAVISDIEMPMMDGLALCRNIKETLQIKDIPVIMFSSLINDQIARKCEDVGANDFISKPQFAKLVDLLDEHCLQEAPA
jgi:two-component system chemotaxis response regulator CheV